MADNYILILRLAFLTIDGATLKTSKINQLGTLHCGSRKKPLKFKGHDHFSSFFTLMCFCVILIFAILWAGLETISETFRAGHFVAIFYKLALT